jgi:hypothetical protein
MFISDVNNEVATVMASIVTEPIDGSEKIALFGGINADVLKICSSDPNNPEIAIYSPDSMASLPLQVSSKAGYSSNITIDQQYQFTSKKYVDD